MVCYLTLVSFSALELVSPELVGRTFVKTLRVLSRIFRRPFPWLKLDNLKDFVFIRLSG